MIRLSYKKLWKYLIDGDKTKMSFVKRLALAPQPCLA